MMMGSEICQEYANISFKWGSSQAGGVQNGVQNGQWSDLFILVLGELSGYPMS